jgi:cell division protein FtsL
MLKNKKQIKKIRAKINRLAWVVGEKAFLVFLILIILIILAGGAIFYRYGYLVVTETPDAEMRRIGLEEEIYQEFLKNYSLRKDIFHEADFKTYLNPFE